MKRLLSILFLFCAVRVFGAAGDVVSMSIRSSGWDMDLAFSAMDTNGTWAFGFGTNNTITGSEKLVLTVWGAGFDDTGASNWTSRIVYGTKQVRFAYSAGGAEAFAYQVLSDPDFTLGNVTNRIALSDYIFLGEVVSNINVGASLYTKTIGNAANTSITVVNDSAVTFPKPVANWTTNGYNVISSSTMTLRATGFHQSAQQGRPLRAMRFVVRDLNSHAVTNYVTQMTKTISLVTGIPVLEYVADVDISSMTQGDNLRCDFTAYPWRGTNTTDTMDGGSLFYGPITNLSNRLGTYGNAWAIVSPTGDNSTGVVSSNAAVTWVSPFLTFQIAMNAISKSNAIWHGAARSNSANSTIYLSAGSHDWFVSGNTLNGIPFPTSWLTLTPYPTNAGVSDTIIKNGGPGEDVNNKRLKFKHLTIASTNAIYSINGSHESIWFDRCTFDDNRGVITTRATNAYFSGITISNVVAGMRLANINIKLMRDIADYTTNGISSRPQTMLAWKRMYAMTANAGTFLFDTDTAITGVPLPDLPIIAFNDFRGINLGASAAGQLFNQATCTNGGALIQNIVENYDNTASSFVLGLASITKDATNLLVWNNTLVGQRTGAFYNDTGTDPVWRILSSCKNNAFDDYNIKSDTFTTPNAARTGNWAALFGVGFSGNITPKTTNSGGSSTAFLPAAAGGFNGISSFMQGLAQTNWFQWVDLQAAGEISRNGMGNYRLKSSSPAIINMQTEWLLPYDFDGVYRGGFDPPGAFASASPRKGGAFFGF